MSVILFLGPDVPLSQRSKLNSAGGWRSYSDGTMSSDASYWAARVPTVPAPPSWPPHPHPSTSLGLRGHFPTYRWAWSTETAKDSHRSGNTPVFHLSLSSIRQTQSWRERKWFKFAEVECQTGTRVTKQEVRVRVSKWNTEQNTQIVWLITAAAWH